ncbi:putative methyltransferase PMT18 [Zea mays]|uniref:Methyltransferase n=1 Tax=Zea mays TaxID=4577 RepID=A0A1D6KR35_MAIZE|nr:putative methyltransferase PMT18 [Zea mays]
MAKDYPASPKAQQLQESKKQRLTYILVVSALCIAFYVLGAWQNTTLPKPIGNSAITRVGCDPTAATAQSSGSVPSFGPGSGEVLDFDAHHRLTINNTDGDGELQQFPACPLNFSEYTPCEDRRRGRRFDRNMLVYRERHCPGKDEQVASWGAYLLKRNIIAMSFAPRDTHEAQVQFALERGVPAIIGVMAKQRLPYPSRAFDMAHCSRCLIPWDEHGEYSKDIFQKPKNHLECANIKKTYKTPHICKSDNPDAAWYTQMEACVTPLPEVSNQGEVAGGAVEKWPERAFLVPPRIKRGMIPGLDAKKFDEDKKLWEKRVAYYKRTIPIAENRYRNVMDMNANMGGFAASLVKYPVWVMNVVPVNSDRDTLGAIYERGFIGTYQDWCEAFSTYPRTYDLLHADNLFSIYQDRCDITGILLEMDRILRPEGTAIIRDTVDVLTKVQAITKRMRWESRIMDHEDGPFNPEKVLMAVKTYWTAEAEEEH